MSLRASVVQGPKTLGRDLGREVSKALMSNRHCWADTRWQLAVADGIPPRGVICGFLASETRRPNDLNFSRLRKATLASGQMYGCMVKQKDVSNSHHRRSRLHPGTWRIPPGWVSMSSRYCTIPN